MSKLFGYGESLKEKTESILKTCDGFINLAIKASGDSFLDTMCGLDAETGAMIGGCVKLYEKSKELVVMQAKAMDNMLDEFDELKEMNKTLREQNETLQRMLRVLIVKSIN